jgi:hypothetical protein
LRISLLTAAAISGVMPGADAQRRRRRPPPESSQSRKSPTVRWRPAKGRRVVAVEDQARDLVILVGNHRLVAGSAQRQSASAMRAAMRSRPCCGHAGQHVARAHAGWPWRAGSSGRQTTRPAGARVGVCHAAAAQVISAGGCCPTASTIDQPSARQAAKRRAARG